MLLYIIKVWVTVACSHAEMPLLCLMASMVKTILGLWCSVVSLLIAALKIHAQRNQFTQTVHRVSPFLVRECHFLTEALEKHDTVRCQGTDHQLRHCWQIYRISVSLSGFKAQTYGCRKTCCSFSAQQRRPRQRSKRTTQWSHIDSCCKEILFADMLGGGQRMPHSFEALNLDEQTWNFKYFFSSLHLFLMVVVLC